MNAEVEFEIHVDEEYYASTFGNEEDAFREAQRYADCEEGFVEVFRVERTKIYEQTN